jgi:hypothetical protein
MKTLQQQVGVLGLKAFSYLPHANFREQARIIDHAGDEMEQHCQEGKLVLVSERHIVDLLARK